MVTCRMVRERVMRKRPLVHDGSSALTPRVTAHLATCARCAAFAGRLELARQALAEPACAAQPDAGFAARVVGRLPRSSDLLGWAALRALPAAVLLALVLAGVSASDVPPPTALLFDEPSASQLLAWSAQGQNGELR